MCEVQVLLQVFSLIAEGNALMFSGVVYNAAPLLSIEASGHYINIEI